MRVDISGWVWLDKHSLSETQLLNLRRLLTIHPRKTTDIVHADDPVPVYLYKEEPDRFGVPRNFYRKRRSVDHDESEQVGYGMRMQALETKYKATGPFKEQDQCLTKLESEFEDQKWGGVLLRAGCAFGKTVVAIELARRLGRRTLVLVHKEFLVNQWRKRIKEFLPDARVGIIQQKKCEYDEVEGGEPDFVIALMQSLAKDDGTRYPKEMYHVFGTVITDECHRIGASTWADLIPKFEGAYRIGLTATPRRKDGAQDVFFEHISEVSYGAVSEGQRPQIRMLFTDAVLKPIRRGDYKVDISDLNSAQIINQLAVDEFRTRAIVDELVGAVRNGRKIMVVSERLSHLKRMAEQLGAALFDMELPFVPVIDFYTGDWYTGEVWENFVRGKSGKILHRRGDLKTKRRKQEDLDKAEEANVIFATKQMVEEALDIPAIDVIALTTPLSDIEQVVGRSRRWCVPEEKKCNRLCSWRAGVCKAKPQPIVLDVVDEQIHNVDSKWRARKRFYKSLKAL